MARNAGADADARQASDWSKWRHVRRLASGGSTATSLWRTKSHSSSARSRSKTWTIIHPAGCAGKNCTRRQVGYRTGRDLPDPIVSCLNGRADTSRRYQRGCQGNSGQDQTDTARCILISCSLLCRLASCLHVDVRKSAGDNDDEDEMRLLAQSAMGYSLHA